MARASVYTHLSLDRFARLFGIAPTHFNQGAGSALWPVAGCGDVWPQWSWQKYDVISREDLAQAIHDAEEDIKHVLGYPVAPEFVTAEQQAWPRHYDRTYVGGPVTATGMKHKSLFARYGKVVDTGRRGTTLIDDVAAVVYSDPDNDGFDELATITATTTVTDPNEIKIYVPGKSASPTWEIRPVRSKSISGGTVTITVDSWLLLDPALWEAYPTGAELQAIDIEDNESYLVTVDVYREYVSKSSALAQFGWETGPSLSCTTCLGAGCASCTLTTQDGCLIVRDSNAGMLTPLPATYDEDDATWTPAYFSVDREPDHVYMWYKAGLRSEEYLAGRTSDPLSDYLAQAIAWLTVARLEADPCGCGRVSEQFQSLRKDLAVLDRSVNTSISIRASETITNPFGSREGEVRAWNRVARLMSAEQR